MVSDWSSGGGTGPKVVYALKSSNVITRIGLLGLGLGLAAQRVRIRGLGLKSWVRNSYKEYKVVVYLALDIIEHLLL